jgi:hypothetical protein
LTAILEEALVERLTLDGTPIKQLRTVEKVRRLSAIARLCQKMQLSNRLEKLLDWSQKAGIRLCLEVPRATEDAHVKAEDIEEEHHNAICSDNSWCTEDLED